MSFPPFPGSQPETRPLFSIEQAELIRRLRNSGITKEQVVQAFESFDRIDEDLGSLYTIPRSLAPNRATASLYTCQTTTASSSTTERAVHGEHSRKRHYSNGTEVSDSLTSEEGSDVTAGCVVSKRSSVDVEDGEVSRDVEDMEYTKQMKRPKDEAVSVNVVMKSGTPIYNNLRGNHQKIGEKLQRQMQRWYLKQNNTVSDLPHLQPTETRRDSSDSADTSGVQQPDGMGYPRESQFLYGPASSRLLQLGSANHLTHNMLAAAAASTEYNASGHLRDIADEQKQAFMRENPMLIRPDDYTESQYTPRRERFTFREKHLEILEAYFKINQYPISDEREMIANKCNTAMAISTGRELDEKERVTNQNVQNWFNNRRKEIKKLARAEGIDYSEVSLPSRLKPRVDFPDCFNISDYPWSHEDRTGKDSYSSYSMVNRYNMKSPPSDEPYKPQTHTNLSPLSSNHISLPVSQSEPTTDDQSETNPQTVENSPQTLSKLRELEPKIKQEIAETNPNNNEASTS